MKTHVTFRSDRFPPCDGEDDEVDPGQYGRRLAEFLAAALNERGVETEAPLAEDWGWCIPLRNEGFALWIGCGNDDEHPDAFLCFIEPHQSTIRKLFRRINVAERVTALQRTLDAILSDSSGIRDKCWWSHEEFNNPRG